MIGGEEGISESALHMGNDVAMVSFVVIVYCELS